jgi:hypothetical protein
MRYARPLTTAGVALALIGVLFGCAGRRDGSEPSAMIGTPPVAPSGVWRGSVTGREMADPNGINFSQAELTINQDGTFVLQDSSGARATGQVRVDGDDLVLDGAFVAPWSRAGERVSDRLHRGRDGALYGSVDTIFRGMRVRAGAGLQQVL